MFNTEKQLLKRLYLTLCSLVKAPQAASDSDLLKTERKQQLKKIVRGEGYKILMTESAFLVNS